VNCWKLFLVKNVPFRGDTLKPYDAKDSQECKICGYSVSHNKQGKFTSHLKSHELSLHEYLILHYYETKDLICTYDLCEKQVSLYRGRPKKHCCRQCASKEKPLKCVTCGKLFEANNRKTKTCSRKCATINRSTNTKRWHASMPLTSKKTHFENIISKTAKSRKINNTPSWNSGKRGIYSEETIEKIRRATLRQMADQTFKKTSIERIVEEFLQKEEITYKYSFILEKRQFDFLLVEHDLIIECDGDYWHANPKFYPLPEHWQVKRINIDKEKNEIAIRNGYRIVRFWEDEIMNNFNKVKSVIYDLLATT
jgi:very-short-patch-repair endonuclease